ncbi:DUF6398 domain-containing protein [Thiotrichales bacterium 19S11-10]|nr:DUF6398 domain-containing protein [Thiotrichales bacterium 19S11-10]
MSDITIPKVPNAIQEKFTEIVNTLNNICNEKLDNHYYELSLKLTTKIARKRPSPLLSGRARTWAAGIVHALGMVNFLFDKANTPYLPSKDLVTWFGLSQSTINGKSKIIRDMFKMSPLDPNWTLSNKMDSNPLIWMVMVNGYILDIRNAPLQLQEEAFEAGIIPYIA